MLSATENSLQFEVRWNGRLLGIERVARGGQLAIAGTTIGVVAGGVVVDGVRRALADDGPLALTCGPLALRVTAERPCAAVRADDVDVAWWRSVSIAVILMMGAVIGLRLTPTFPDLSDDELGRGRLLVSRTVVAPVVKPPAPPTPTQQRAPRPVTEVAATTAAPKTMKQRRDRDHHEALAALKLMGIESGAATSSVFGSGNAVALALSQLNAAGMASGGDGLGTRPTGGGGGGTSIGIGVLGSGTGRGTDDGPGNIDLEGRGKSRTKVTPGKVVYVGALDREEIQRVLSRAMSRIKYCYERELTQHQDLEGKLVLSWTIGGSGDVVSAASIENTMGNTAVDACVVKVMRSLKFPSPKGGGVVSVTYPFVFSAH